NGACRVAPAWGVCASHNEPLVCARGSSGTATDPVLWRAQNLIGNFPPSVRKTLGTTGQTRGSAEACGRSVGTVQPSDEVVKQYCSLLRGFLVSFGSMLRQRAVLSASMPAVSEEAGRERGVYSIGAVARMLEIPVATIRNWE